MVDTAEPRAGVDRAATVGARLGRPLPWPVGVAAAMAGGGALLLAFPPYGRWWSAPVGVALLAAAVHRRRPLAGFGLGALAGLTFFLPLLSWTNLHTGNLPWLLLGGLQASYLGLLGAAGAVTGPLVDRWRWSWPAVTGVLWVAQEALRDRTPFGGFPWGRLAFSQEESPLLRLAAWGGAPLVTFAVALAGGLVVTAAAALLFEGPGGVVAGRWRRVGAPVVGVVALVAAAAVTPLGSGAAGEPVTVALVQGNVPRMGLDFNAQRRAVLDNHVNATLDLAARVRAGQAPQPALVVWPENASDIDPIRNQDAAVRIAAAATAIGAPVLVGAVLRGPGPNQVRNAGLLWLPGTGPDQVYIKRHPVPFAEYVPLRRVARLVSDQVDRVRADFVAGSEPGVLRVGSVVLGDVICFEVAYDEVVRDTVTGGAQLLVVQTNNATFNVAEARQQLAMVRLRAVEHGRDALMASTVGVSGFVDRQGRVFEATGFNTAAVVVRQMRPAAGRTVATRLGSWPEVVLVTLALVTLVAAVAVRRRAAGAPAAHGAPAGSDGGRTADAEGP